MVLTKKTLCFSGNIAENREELVMPYLQALSEFREKIREIAREKKVIDILDVRLILVIGFECAF